MPVIEPGRPTIKTLFALSRNICALPSCEQKLTSPRWPRVKARVAHIRGEKPGSARYDPTMTDKARAHFNNLILLCPTCHSIIDELEPDRYTVEVLEDIKARHEGGYRAKPWATDDELTQVAILLGQQLVSSGVFTANPENVAIDSTPRSGVDIRMQGSQAVERSAANGGSPTVARRQDATVAPATISGKVELPMPMIDGTMTSTAPTPETNAAAVVGSTLGMTDNIAVDLQVQDASHAHTSTNVDLTTGEDEATAGGPSPATAHGEARSSGSAAAL